jgi:hypothetical protein
MEWRWSQLQSIEAVNLVTSKDINEVLEEFH